MSSTVFNRVTRRQLVAMADWDWDSLSSSSLSNCMAARVRVRSDGIGKGTTFTVHLPLIAVYFEPDKESRHSRTAPRENHPLPDVST